MYVIEFFAFETFSMEVRHNNSLVPYSMGLKT